jgi:hypothetical protein
MGHDVSLLFPQEPVPGPYLEQDESIPCLEGENPVTEVAYLDRCFDG